MTPERHAQAGQAFLRAREMSEEERSRFLQNISEELRREVERLLKSDPDQTHFLERPLLDPRAGLEDAAAPAHHHTPDPSPDLPLQAGAYRIIRTLGDGGSSTVYLAEQTSPVRRQVAIKVLRHPGARGEAAARFRAECEAIARMQHPGIAAMFEAGLTAGGEGGRPFFVMEYIPGGPVTDYCRRADPLLQGRLNLFLQITAAVAHAHQKGVVHRDLKPTNILVAETTDGPRAKVIDFGVAKSLSAPARTYATSHGQLVGTLAYMSPEQLAGDPRHVDVRTDIYALGAVLHEMLTGRPAFDLEGLELPAAIRKIEQGQRNHTATRAGLPRDLALIIGKAMAPEPQRRYQSTLELAAEIQRFLENRPVLARGPGPFYIARKFAARHRLLVGAVCISLAVLVISGFSVWSQRERAERHYRVSKAAAMSYMQMVDDVADQIGARRTRKALLARAMEQTAAFSAQERADPEVQQARARILLLLGDIEAEEGRTLHAQTAFEEALQLRQQIAAREPHNPEHQADLSFATVRVGDMHQGERAAQAMPYYRAALEIDRRLAAQHPDNRRYISNLAWSYQRIGARSQVLGRHEEALEYFNLQFQTIDRLEALGGKTDNVERCRSSAYTHLSRDAQRRGEAARALELAILAKDAAERAIASAPDSRFARLFLAGAWFTIGVNSAELGDHAGAHHAAEQGAQLLAPLLHASPDDAPVLEQFLHACHTGIAVGRAMGSDEVLRRWEGEALRAVGGWKGESPGPELALTYPLISQWRAAASAGGPP